MAFMTRCCCCELRVGVIVIATVGIILGVANFGKSINDVRGFSAARKYIEDNPNDLDKYGITLEFLDALEGFTITSIVIDVISVIVHILIFVPAAYRRREDGRKYRFFLLIWLVFSVISVIYCFAFIIWAFVVFKIALAAVFVSVLFVIIIFLTISLMLVVIAFYQQLGEPEATPGIQPGCTYVSQATAYRPGYGTQQVGQPQLCYENPPEYSEKGGIP